MSIDKHLYQWKQRFNDSCFFSTEVSSTQRLHGQDSKKGIFRISSKFTDEPSVYLRKVKGRYKQAYNQHLSAVRNNIRLRNSADKAQKNASMCRYEFIKLYHNKKFRLSENASMSDHKADNQRNFRLSIEKFRRKRWEDEISANLRKEYHMKRIQELQQNKKMQEKKFRQTFRATEQKFMRQALDSHEKVRQERLRFYQRKKNLQDLASTKSKFHYMSKINDEMLRIKQCQERLRGLDDQDYNRESSSQGRTLPNIFATTFTTRFN